MFNGTRFPMISQGTLFTDDILLIIVVQHTCTYHNILQCDNPEVNSEIRGRAQQIAERLSFDGFIEASAKNNHKVEWIFEKAVCLVSVCQIFCIDNVIITR